MSWICESDVTPNRPILNLHLVISGDTWDGEPSEKEDGNFGAKDSF
jgi:hypothetical protein